MLRNVMNLERNLSVEGGKKTVAVGQNKSMTNASLDSQKAGLPTSDALFQHELDLDKMASIELYGDIEEGLTPETKETPDGNGNQRTDGDDV